MAQVHIVYTSDPNSQPLVLRYDTTVRPGETIAWCIWSLNTDVRRVQISFVDAGNTFFAGPSVTTTADLVGGAYDKSDPFIVLGEVCIVGAALKFLGKRTECKYSIRAFDSKGTPLPALDLDPKIIIDEP